MTVRLHKLALATLTSLVLLAPLASGASAETRNGKMLPSRQMMRHHSMMHPHHRMMHHRMMRHRMMHRRAM